MFDHREWVGNLNITLGCCCLIRELKKDLGWKTKHQRTWYRALIRTLMFDHGECKEEGIGGKEIQPWTCLGMLMFDQRELWKELGWKPELERTLGRWYLIRESCRKVPERKPNFNVPKWDAGVWLKMAVRRYQRESRTSAYLGTLVFDQREL